MLSRSGEQGRMMSLAADQLAEKRRRGLFIGRLY